MVLHREPGELRDAREAVRSGLTSEGLGALHALAVAAVVNELVSAARECRVTSPLALTIATYGRPDGSVDLWAEIVTS